MKIKFSKTDDDFRVEAPYNTYFIDGARTLSGKFKKPEWVFDLRDEQSVRELCMEAYGPVPRLSRA